MNSTQQATESLRGLYGSGYTLSGFEAFYEDFPSLMKPKEMNAYRQSESFRKTNLAWGKAPLKNSQVSGYMMGLNDRFLKSGRGMDIESYYEFYKKHYNETTNKKEFIDRRDGEAFSDYFERWAEDWANNHPSEKGDTRIGITEWFIHIVIQSYEGFIGEELVKSWLLENAEGLKKYAGYDDNDVIDVIESNDVLDWHYNSDLLVTRNGEPLFSIQVKPRSYFHNKESFKGGLSFQKDKENHQIKDMKLLKDYGLRQYYIDKESIIKQDYPIELIRGESLFIHKNHDETWTSIIEHNGEFRRLKAYRQTPSQYVGYPY